MVSQISYFENDPRDIRNYRPITLLNCDYKIWAKLIAARLKKVMDSIISHQQKGFVPHHLITSQTRLTKLLQAYLDETDEAGLIIFLDMEKAFDSCSHEYLVESMRRLGFGETMVRRIAMVTCDAANPSNRPGPKRRLRVNGQKGPAFNLRAGVAQGCPISALAFLFITEGFTRLVESEQNFKGIKVNGVEHKLSQFADDTVLYLRGWAVLPKMWRTIDVWQECTGMQVNRSKTEGLRAGRLRHAHYTGAGTEGINWCEPGSYIAVSYTHLTLPTICSV